MRLLIFGLGYSASVLAARLRAWGWHVAGTSRAGASGTLRFDDDAAVLAELARATHVLSSVPAEDGGDPVLERYGTALSEWGAVSRAWLGYLSSTGVYGDADGAWVDEHAPLNGRRPHRIAADRAWQALGARVFRLPGIYGPGRSPLDRVASGAARLVDAPGQVFSRIHVDDLARGVIAGFDAPPGAYNLADDVPASQNDVMMFTARLLEAPPPPLVALDTLGAVSRAFYAENRRVANGKAKRVLGWTPLYADYRAGLRALSATTSPTTTSAAPPAASPLHR